MSRTSRRERRFAASDSLAIDFERFVNVARIIQSVCDPLPRTKATAKDCEERM